MQAGREKGFVLAASYWYLWAKQKYWVCSMEKKREQLVLDEL